MELIELFPKEAGFANEARTIPYLPGKKLIGSLQEKTTIKRRAALENYCKELIQLKHSISRNELVLDFFASKPSDINPPKDAT